MGLVTMGFATMTTVGIVGGGDADVLARRHDGALFCRRRHGLRPRPHARTFPDLGGMAKVLPWPAIAFIIGGLVSMGMPGFSGFVAELQIFMGLWQAGETVAWYYRVSP